MFQLLRPVLSWSSLWLMLPIPIILAACTGSANAVDREPLVALFNATDGPNWSDNSTWVSGRSLDVWYGLVTASDGSGRVIDVSLGENQLSGELPPELGNLTALKTLGLLDNRLSGELPPELENLSNLKGLYFQDNQFSGAIPPEWGSLPSLKGLGLSGNQLSEQIPPELANLSNLKALDLAHNRFSGEIPAELGNLPLLAVL